MKYAIILGVSFFLSISAQANDYGQCVESLIKSYKQPLSKADKKNLLAAISNNCRDKRTPMDQLEAQCQSYLYRTRYEQGASAVLKGFDRCHSLADKMREAPITGEKCDLRICAKINGEEKCINKPSDFFNQTTADYCAKWTPLARCVLDYTFFGNKGPSHVYWTTAQYTGKVDCKDL